MSTQSLTTHHRYERKYLAHNHSVEELRNALLLSNALFHEIYYKRRVNSIYFDTPELEYFQQNVNGDPHRRKVRVRWYGAEDALQNPQLEVKVKQGEIMYKEVYPLNLKSSGQKQENLLDELTGLVQSTLRGMVPESNLLAPVLLNSYERSYFYSSATGIRVTLDGSLSAQNIHYWLAGNQRRHDFDFAVLECKYDLVDDGHLREVIQHLPIHISKSSKYVMGMQQSYPHLFG